MFLKRRSISNIYILLFLLGCCHNTGVAQNLISVNGALFGRPIETKVDHKLAKAMLTNPDDSSVLQLFSDYRTHELNTETLSEIAQKYSTDVSILFFVERLYEQEKNKQAQDYYLSMISENMEQKLSLLQDYYIVFVPGFRYKHAVNGSDFLSQRHFLDSIGMAYEMIETQEIGLAEDNAGIIIDRLRELNKRHSNIIVISVSKGSLDAAVAFGTLSNIEEISSVKAWINVCGILKGTPVADTWIQPFRRWWLSRGLFLIGERGINVKGVLTGMSYNRCKEEYKALKIPTEILTVSLTAVPLGKQGKKRKIPVPNDGFSPLADSIIEDGVVVIEVGLDHYFRGVDLNNRMITLLCYIVNQLN